MDRTFTMDLDKALSYLYKRQYSLEEPADTSDGCVTTRSVKEYIRVQGWRIDFDAPNTTIEDIPYPGEPLPEGIEEIQSSDAHMGYVLQQLVEDGFIQRHMGNEKPPEEHLHLTNKGRLFHDADGYRGRRRSQNWATARTIFATIANALNAMVILSIAIIALLYQIRSVEADEADVLKDEQMIQLEKRNTVLHERNAAIEQLLETEQARSHSLEHELLDRNPAPVPVGTNR